MTENGRLRHPEVNPFTSFTHWFFGGRKLEEARLKAEAQEQARRAEQIRRQAEALKKLEERSKAPWAQAPQAPPPTSQTSLAEIQRLEREKKAVSCSQINLNHAQRYHNKMKPPDEELNDHALYYFRKCSDSSR